MIFFFSSRRRHTRCSRDWSSDVCSSDLEVALTFDDGPNDPYTLQLLDLLDRWQVRATFFLMGSFVRQRPEIARAIQDRKSTRLNSSHGYISYAVFCLKKKTKRRTNCSRI